LKFRFVPALSQMIVSLVMMIRYVVLKMIVPIVHKLLFLILQFWQINALKLMMKIDSGSEVEVKMLQLKLLLLLMLLLKLMMLLILLTDSTDEAEGDDAEETEGDDDEEAEGDDDEEAEGDDEEEEEEEELYRLISKAKRNWINHMSENEE